MPSFNVEVWIAVEAKDGTDAHRVARQLLTKAGVPHSLIESWPVTLRNEEFEITVGPDVPIADDQ